MKLQKFKNPSNFSDWVTVKILEGQWNGAFFIWRPVFYKNSLLAYYCTQSEIHALLRSAGYGWPEKGYMRQIQT